MVFLCLEAILIIWFSFVCLYTYRQEQLMKNQGFVKVMAAAPKLKVADCSFNTSEIIRLINEAEKQNVTVIVFPELCLTSYTAQDLFNQRILLEAAKLSLLEISKNQKGKSVTSIVGLPLEINSQLYNVAAVLQNGQIKGFVPKTFLPNYNEFYDKRWFSSSKELSVDAVNIGGQYIPIGTNMLFNADDFKFAIEICEDLWTPLPPSTIHTLHGAEIIFNLSASSETIGKHKYRQALVSQQSARTIAGYVYASAGNGESTTDLVFAGSCIIAENGEIITESERFSFDSQYCVTDIDIEKIKNLRLKNKSFTLSEYGFLKTLDYRNIELEVSGNKEKEYKLQRKINPNPFIPSSANLDARCSDVFSIQIGGLAKRLLHTNIKNVVLGVSGGLDSTLALLVTAKAFDKLNIPRENIYGITMPGFGTTDRTYNNAIALMKALNISIKEIPIKDAVIQHFKDIEHDINVHDTTYENSQARERTQILMDYANKVNGLVIGTGDLSELALGWCTYNGDQMSMYGINAGIPKTLVKTLIQWICDTHMDKTSKEILSDILNTPVSPELLPADSNGQITQLTEDTVGPYILHDFFIYNMLGLGYEPSKIYFLAKYAFKDQFSDNTILKWLKVFYKRFFSQQFKRSCMPDGPKIGTINLSPRGDLRMPSDASAALWLAELETMQ